MKQKRESNKRIYAYQMTRQNVMAYLREACKTKDGVVLSQGVHKQKEKNKLWSRSPQAELQVPVSVSPASGP